MNTRQLVRRIEAYHAGKPLRSSETLHLHIADPKDLLVVAFLRMGGESRPWGIAYGPPSGAPTVLTVPDGRRRTDVAVIAAKFADDLLEHIRCPGFSVSKPGAESDLKPLRQLWLPNGSHLEMLHHLAYAYTFTKWGDGLQAKLNALGRAAGWLFREAHRPGQQYVVVATDAIRSAHTFPAEDVRQGHLEYLLTWLAASGDRDARIAAAMEAERRAMSTNLDPDVERTLESTMDAWRAAVRANDLATAAKSAAQIDHALCPELIHRFELVKSAIQVFREDGRRPNAALEELVDASISEQWYQHTRTEIRIDSDHDGPAFVPSVETDRHPAAAASRYLIHEASQDLIESVLLHDDSELLAEAIAEGDAFRGTIIGVDDEGEGKGKATFPIWTIEMPYAIQTRLRTGSKVCVVGRPSRTARIREIRGAEGGGYVFELELTNLKTAIKSATGIEAVAPVDSRWVGEEIACVAAASDGISRAKSFRIWKVRKGAGAWLTHTRPGGPLSVVASDDTDDVPVVEAGLERQGT